MTPSTYAFPGASCHLFEETRSVMRHNTRVMHASSGKLRPRLIISYCCGNSWIKLTLSPFNRICPSVRRASASLAVACRTSTAESMTRFMNSSKPCYMHVSSATLGRRICRSRSVLTLIYPSILNPNCSYNHIETWACDVRRRKMKLMGGMRTLSRRPPPCLPDMSSYSPSISSLRSLS
jgi:hypothetical protein